MSKWNTFSACLKNLGMKLKEPEKKQPVTKSRKERDLERKRNEILDTAEKLFFSQGYEKTSINDIAAESEFSKGTIYLYFTGKSEIYLAIANRSLDIILDMMKTGVDPNQSGANQLRKGFHVFLDFLNKYPDYFKMWIYSVRYIEPKLYLEHPLGNECRQKERQLMMLNMNAVIKGLQDGSIKSDAPPPLVALSSLIFSRGLHQFLLEGGDLMITAYGVSKADLINHMESIYFKGLGITIP